MKTEQNRREFLKGAAWTSLAAMAGGCQFTRMGFGTGAPMAGFAAPPLKRIRVAFVGIGLRGTYALRRISQIPGVDVTAICDVSEERMKVCRDFLAEKKLPPAKEFLGPEAYKDVAQYGGADFIMDLRWIYSLQNGLPLDMDVYDLASWSCLCEVTEKSCNRRGASVDIPDFTRGAWKTRKPLTIEALDLRKMDFRNVGDAGPQQTV